MSDIVWGPEIAVNGVRPEWLKDGLYDRVGVPESEVLVSARHWPWAAIGEIRLPADHPFYNTRETVSGADGSGYYDIVINGHTISCNDIIDTLGLNFNHGEAFKALFRCGRKPGVPKSYDLDKVMYFAAREKGRGE